ncbi:prepilin peptidase [Bradyrhizobium jicamae]|uniref:A24 family peptidase n=1 Tax=Bradyrhizobium jicamae TaxID=280332 RepID=UPI001BA5F5D1|nr:prepilin peptidase [Bradyrhizobium jicamae]MBR0939083.1 prepilin peptidase [Bradyrhizobium jicamae]
MTAFPVGWSQLVLVVTSAVLLQTAWTDLREYKIRNDRVLALLGLFVLYAVLNGQWAGLGWNVAFAALMFLAMFVFYLMGWMGAGDVKIMGVAFLWTGISDALMFAILLGLFCAMHSLAATRGWVKSRETASGHRGIIPFAPSVAAALICIFILRAAHVDLAHILAYVGPWFWFIAQPR